MTSIIFRAGIPENWEAGIEHFAVRGTHPHMEIFGPCPQCEHELTRSLKDVTGAGLAGQAGRLQTIRVVCNCAHFHEGAGPKDEGCGAEGYLEILV